MGIYIDLEQGTEEWLNWRKTKLTASDAPIILGVSPYRTKYELWMDKLGLSTPQEKTSAMQRGNDLEPIVRKLMSEKLDYDFEPAVFQHSDIEWFSCSMDGIDLCQNIAIEIKCPGKIDHDIAGMKRVPDKYYPQLMAMIEICNLESIWYCSYHNDNLVYFEVFRDQKFIDDMLLKLKEFWDSIQNLEMPGLTSKDKNLQAKKNIIERDDEEWNKSMRNYHTAMAAAKSYQESADHWKERLISLSDGKPSRGAGYRLDKIEKIGIIDFSNILELKDVDLEKYRKPSTTYWKITRDEI